MLRNLGAFFVILGLTAWSTGCESSSDSAATDTAAPADTAGGADVCGPSAPAPFGLTVTRLYADEAGESHFDDTTIPLVEYAFVAGAPTVNLSAPGAAATYLFLETDEGWRAGLHPTLTRQISIVVRGGLRVLTSDGDQREFWPGDVILSEDTTGKGHESIALGKGSNMLMMISLPPDTTE